VQKLTSEEFFRYGLHRPTISDAECWTFLCDRAMWRFNDLLNGTKDQNHTDLLMDKLGTAEVLMAAGIPVAKELATYHPETGTLRTADEVSAFLLNPANLPLFGKPVHARSTLGVAAVERVVSDGMVELGDKRIVSAVDLAAEIVAHYQRGYVFQELLRASDAMRPMSGPVVPTLRVTTLLLGGEPVPLYAALRLPAMGAMADDGGSGANARLYLDVKTGAVLRGQDMSRFGGIDLALTPVTKIPLKGQMVPDWPEVLRLSVDVHRQFPRHTCVGTDIALSDRGLVVNEANAHPHHMTYQMVSNRGILNDEFRPLFRQALAEKGVTSAPKGIAWPFE
jgi:Sugar-transfer associated ATP-grasp